MGEPCLNGENKTLQFPEDFKKTLELLVLEILRQKPDDPLEFASNFLLKELQRRQESNVDDEQKEEEKERSSTSEALETKCGPMSATQAATIIQSCFRRYTARQNHWRKRFLVTKLTDHDHLNSPLYLDFRDESFSIYDMSDGEDVCFHYESDNSVENMKL